MTQITHHGTITFRQVMEMYKEIIQGRTQLFKNYKLFAQNQKKDITIIESKQTRHNYSYRKRQGYEEIAQNRKAQKRLGSIDDILDKEISNATMYLTPTKILGMPIIDRKKIEIKKEKHNKYQITITSKKDIVGHVYKALIE